MNSRYRSRFSLLLFLIATSVMADQPNATATHRPNVLLIITDDQGFGDFSLHGNPHVSTPHIDQLGRSSVRFERFFVNSFCAPTRAALLTGRYPLRSGVHGVTHNREAMRPTEVTIAEALQGAGYRTACIGKWHNGEQFPYTPQGQGFHESFGFNNGHWNNYFDATLLRGSQTVATTGFISDVLTDDAIQFITTHRNQPFFCYLAFNAPHSPFQVPASYFDKFKAKGLEDSVAAFYGMCENIDDNVGRVLRHLEQLKLAEDTIVIFLTDNGGTAGVKLFNAGMRGGKTSVHEGGTRVPLFVRWPAAKWQPHVAQPIVAHIDLYPTLLDLCGVKPPAGPKIDGVSLRPLLETSPTPWPERVLFTHNPTNETNKFPGAVRTQRERLVCEAKGAGPNKAPTWQLFDMEADPGQAKDIASEQPLRVAELSRLYDEWFTEISREGLRRFPIPVGHPQHNPVELHAPQAFFSGQMHFASGPGWANDWLTDWTDIEGKLWFEIEVAQTGQYDFDIAYVCPAEEAGSTLRLRIGDDAAQSATVLAAPIKPLPLPHRDAVGHDRYRDRDWSTLRLGTHSLKPGLLTITLEATQKPGRQVLDFKHLKLRRLSDSTVSK